MSALADFLDDSYDDDIDDITLVAQRAPDSGAILAIDIGSVYTRAILIDTADGMYRLFARGQAPTTSDQPWNNALRGVSWALQQISDVTARTLNRDLEIIIPEQGDFYGVSAVAATCSAGRPIRAVVVGLSRQFSIESARNAAQSVYFDIVRTMSLEDGDSIEEQIDAIIQAMPDVIIVVGGTDGGARRTVQNLIEAVTTACLFIDRRVRPTVLYAGNRQLAEGLADKLTEEMAIRANTADNVRPSLDVEVLDGARTELALIYNRQKRRSTGGFEELAEWAGGVIYPTAHAFGQMIALLGEMEGQNVLGVDLGSAATTIAAIIGGRPYLTVFNRIGVGHSILGALEQIRMDNLLRWLAVEGPDEETLLDMFWNRSISPHAVPTSRVELEALHALAREIIRHTMRQARAGWAGYENGAFPAFGTIVLAGSTLTATPHDGLSALLALDALQLTGMSRLVLDPYGVTAALGAVAPISPRAAVQVLDTGAYIDLGTTIGLLGRARPGEIVLRGKITPTDGREHTFEVEYGSLALLPLEPGVEADVILQTQRGVEIPGGVKKLRITGGQLGIIVDARGRPWRPLNQAAERVARNRAWQAMITGSKVEGAYESNP